MDDDEGVREYVRVNLEAEGYEVREAGSAEEGLAALFVTHPPVAERVRRLRALDTEVRTEAA